MTITKPDAQIVTLIVATHEAATVGSVRAYREAMGGFAGMRTVDVWYSRLSADDILDVARRVAKRKRATREAKRGKKAIEKARTRDSLQGLSKMIFLSITSVWCCTFGNRWRGFIHDG